MNTRNASNIFSHKTTVKFINCHIEKKTGKLVVVFQEKDKYNSRVNTMVKFLPRTFFRKLLLDARYNYITD